MAASDWRRLGCASDVGLRQLYLDQLREERDGDQVVPAHLVEAAMQAGRSEGGLTARQVQADYRRDGLREILIPAEQLLGLLEPALGDAKRRQPGWPDARIGPSARSARAG